MVSQLGGVGKLLGVHADVLKPPAHVSHMVLFGSPYCRVHAGRRDRSASRKRVALIAFALAAEMPVNAVRLRRRDMR